MLITGSLIQSYGICQRQTWLMAHQVIPDQEHPYIEMGRLLDETSYDRDKKKIHFENVVLDLMRADDGDVIVGEVKKSSKAEYSARLQLTFYLYKLKQSGVTASGILLFPSEKKRVEVKLTTDMEKELEEIFNDIYSVIYRETPPPFKKIGYCKNCGYKEFCWS